MAGSAPTTDAWREVLALFDRWVTADSIEREGLVRQIKAEQPALYTRLVAMIDADQAAEARDFLGEGASLVSAVSGAAPETQWAGMQLGSWKLLEPIGSGGMGQVWLATRSDGLYSGRAAVKLLHATSVGAQAQARFAREGELLARLSHPNIAQLLDAGLSADGTRYLVLEYVPGERIDHWCDANHLGINDRVRLFMQVCNAVTYAHAHLVVHRDLKPANILVSDDGHVKLLDFGVAKLLVDTEDGSEPTELTRAGPAGLTPEYAAPEQVEGTAVTTATDVYALGVVLFGLLSGARPYGGTSRGVAALARAIVEEPARSLAAALRESPDAALSRGSSLAALEQALRGDLETIVAKALKKVPAERYATVQELRDDLQHHLAHEPVSAQPDSFGYRARKFAQRNRPQVVALVALVFTLVGGIVATTWQWHAATQEAERTRSVLKVLTDIFTDLAPDETGTAQVPVLDLLRKGWSQVQTSLKDDPGLRAEVARPLGLMLESSGDMVTAIAALSISRDHLVATDQVRTRQYLQVLQVLAYAQSRVGQSEEAKKLLREIIAVADKMKDTTAVEPVNAQIQLGEIARREGHLQQAREQLAQAIGVAKRRLGTKHPAYILALQEQADVMRELGQWQETKQLLTSIVSAANSSEPSISLVARFNAATLDVELGQFREAASQLSELAQDMTKFYGANDTYAIYAYTWLSMALFHSGRIAESDLAIATANQSAEQSTEPNVKQTVQTVLARQLLRRDRCREAEPLLHANLAHFESGEATSRPFAERTRMLLAECQLRTGAVAESLRTLKQTLENQRAFYGAKHLDLWPTLLLQALALDAINGISAALPAYEEASDMALAMLPPEHPDRLRVAVFQAQARWRADRSVQAKQAFEVALTNYGQILQGRPDRGGFSVLTSKLLEQGPAAQFSLVPLLALLTY